MAKKLVGALLLLSAASGCNSSSQTIDDHWNASSVPPRVARAILGYDAERVAKDAEDESKGLPRTIMRHFLNDNPDNPSKERSPVVRIVNGVSDLITGSDDE